MLINLRNPNAEAEAEAARSAAKQSDHEVDVVKAASDGEIETRLLPSPDNLGPR